MTAKYRTISGISYDEEDIKYTTSYRLTKRLYLYYIDPDYYCDVSFRLIVRSRHDRHQKN